MRKEEKQIEQGSKREREGMEKRIKKGKVNFTEKEKHKREKKGIEKDTERREIDAPRKETKKKQKFTLINLIFLVLCLYQF